MTLHESRPQRPASYAPPVTPRTTAEVYAELGHALAREAEDHRLQGDDVEARVLLEAASDAFAESLRRQPDVRQLRRYLADVLNAQGEVSRALKQYLEAASGGPPLDIDALGSAHALLTAGLPRTDVMAALAWGARCPVDMLDDTERRAVHRFVATAAELGGEIETAVLHWREAVARAQHDLDLQERLADALRRAGRPSEAADVLRDELKMIRPDGDVRRAARVRLTLGRSLLDIGRAAEARVVLEAALHSGGGFDAALEVELARCALAMGAAQQGLAHAMRARAHRSLTPDLRAAAEVQRARALALLGRTREAADAAQRALELSPADPEAVVIRAAALLDAGADAWQAQNLLQLHLRDHPDDARAYRLLVRALRDGDMLPDEAAGGLESLAGTAPDAERRSLLVELARVRLLQGDARAAAQALDQADDGGAWEWDARSALTCAATRAHLGDLDRAAELYEQAADAGIDDVHTLRAYALAMAAHDEPRAAELAWRQLVARAPDDAEAQEGLARALIVTGNSTEALAAADEVLRLGANSADATSAAHGLRAEVLRAAGAPDTSVADALFEAGRWRPWSDEEGRAASRKLLTEAHRLRPDHAPTCWYLADLELVASVSPTPPYVEADALRAGITWWERGNEAPAGEWTWALVTRAWLEHQRARLPGEPWALSLWRAVTYLERALVLGEPTNDRLRLLALTHRYLENPVAALEALDRATKTEPPDVDVLDERAACLANVGRYTEAEAELVRRREVAETIESSAVLAWLMQRHRRHSEAIGLLRSVIEADPHEPWYRQMLADSLRRMGRTAEAVRELEELALTGHGPSVAALVRAKAAWARYNLFLLGVASPAALDQARSMYAEVRTALGGRAHETREFQLSHGFCLLALGDLGGGARDVEAVIPGLRWAPELDDLLEDIDDLRASAAIPEDRRAALHAVLDQLRTRAVTRRAEAAGDDFTAEDELQRTLRSETDPASWPAVGAAASLARIEAARGEARAAAALYRRLAADASDQFPETRQALDRLADDADKRGLMAMDDQEPTEALRFHEDALLFARDGDDARLAGIHAHAIAAALEAGADPARHIAGAARRYAASDVGGDPYVALGVESSVSLNDVERYWSLDERWSLVAPPAGEPDATERARAGLRTFLERRFGMVTADEWARLLPTAIVLELGDGLVAEDTGEDWDLFARYIPDMRAAIERDVGVRVPGVRVRRGYAFPDEGYAVAIADTTIARGLVPLDRRWASGAPLAMMEAGVSDADIEWAADPRTGAPGAWLASAGWGPAERGGFRVEHDPLEFVIHRLERLLRDNVAEFVGPDEIDEILRRWALRPTCAELIERTMTHRLALPRLTRVVRALVHDGVPLTDSTRIVKVVHDVGLGDESGALLVAALRRAVRAQLPGNEPGRQHWELPGTVEAELRAAVLEDAWLPGALPVSHANTVVEAARDAIGDAWRPPALVTAPELAPLIRRELRDRVPGMPVLATDEIVHPLSDAPPAATAGDLR